MLPYLNNPKELDPSCKMDLDLWVCFGRKKILSYNQRNAVSANLILTAQSDQGLCCSKEPV